MKFLIGLCAFVVCAASIKLPPNFKTCNRKDPNFKTCLLEAGQYGITQFRRPYKQFKLPNLEPLKFSELSANVEAPIINVVANLTNCKFNGLTKTQLKNFEFDFERKTIDLSATFPLLTSSCNYVIDGRILMLPITGQGSSAAAFEHFHWTFHLNYEEVVKNNKTYVKPVSSEFKGKPENVSITFNELFDGDQKSTELVNLVISQNWSDLWDDVAETYFGNASQVWLQLMTGFFAKISLEEAFDN